MIRRGLPGGSFKPLTEDSIEKIHQTVLRIIEEVGFQVHSDEGRRLFKEAGAIVNEEQLLVKLPRENVFIRKAS